MMQISDGLCFICPIYSDNFARYRMCIILVTEEYFNQIKLLQSLFVSEVIFYIELWTYIWPVLNVVDV